MGSHGWGIAGWQGSARTLVAPWLLCASLLCAGAAWLSPQAQAKKKARLARRAEATKATRKATAKPSRKKAAAASAS